MNYYHPTPPPGPYQNRQFPFLFGAPLLGGFVGGLIGSALLRPRPPYYGGYPYPGGGGYPYPPYGGYGPYY